MKKTRFFDLLRWVVLPLLLASIIAWAVANAAPVNVSHVMPKQVAAIAPAIAANNVEVQELKTRLKELEDANRKNYEFELDGQRKQADWWLTFLGVLAAIMAITGGLFPYLMARKDKEIIEQDKTQIRALLVEVKGMKDVAKANVEEIHRHKEMLDNFQSGSPSASNPELDQALVQVEQDKTADPLVRLHAEGRASQNKLSKPIVCGRYLPNLPLMMRIRNSMRATGHLNFEKVQRPMRKCNG